MGAAGVGGITLASLFLCRRHGQHQPHRCPPHRHRHQRALHGLRSQSCGKESADQFRRCWRQLRVSQSCAQGVLHAPAAGDMHRTGSEKLWWAMQARQYWLRNPSCCPAAQPCTTPASASHAHSCTGPWDAWTVLRAHFVTCALRVRRNEGRRASSMLYELAVSSAGRSPVPDLQKSPARGRSFSVAAQSCDDMEQWPLCTKLLTRVQLGV